jgi:hypothetical protein
MRRRHQVRAALAEVIDHRDAERAAFAGSVPAPTSSSSTSAGSAARGPSTHDW